MLTRRQKVALVGAGLYVVLALALAIVKLNDGAWIQGTMWVVAGVGFGCAYGITLLRWRRA